MYGQWVATPKGGANLKPYLSWDCRLQLADMNVKSLVIVCHQRTVNMSLLLAHTARRSIRV